MELSNPYFQIGAGLILVIISVFSLHLNLRKIVESIIVFFTAFSSSPTAREEKQLKEGVAMPLGCWTMVLGMGLTLMGAARLVAIRY